MTHTEKTSSTLPAGKIPERNRKKRNVAELDEGMYLVHQSHMGVGCAKITVQVVSENGEEILETCILVSQIEGLTGPNPNQYMMKQGTILEVIRKHGNTSYLYRV